MEVVSMFGSKKIVLSVLAVFAIILAFSPVQAAESDKTQTHANKKEQIVMFRDGTAEATRMEILKQKGATIVRELPLINAYLVSFQKFSLNAVVLLQAEPTVENVQPDQYHIWLNVTAGPPLPSITAALGRAIAGAKAIPSVPGRAQPNAEKNSEIPWGVERLGAPKIWNRSTGKGVNVAVIDTGIDMQHPDLAANIKGGFNAVDPGESPQDDQGHGTHVAGTIAAVPNKKGVIGVAPNANLYAVKVLDKDGGGTFSSIIAGISWAVENGMHIANMSLGGPSSPPMEKAVKAAHAAGLTIVAARMMHLSPQKAEGFYAEHRERPFFNDLAITTYFLALSMIYLFDAFFLLLVFLPFAINPVLLLG
ncbi:MAG: hypothetical protein COB53_11245 [Elusimicrobia bacterium]|nr:MAG: hypothetical protein COB53_11245 [Elusimicrobiota bacterium]